MSQGMMCIILCVFVFTEKHHHNHNSIYVEVINDKFAPKSARVGA